MNEIDIASFAESLLEEGMASGKPAQFSAATEPDAPDVSDVDVPSHFASQVLSEGHWDKADLNVESPPQEDVPVPRPQKQLVSEDILSEASAYKKYLVKEYKKKVSDLQELVSLMEDVGLIEESVGGGVTTVGMGAGMPVMGRRKKRKGDDPFKERKTRRAVRDGLSRRLGSRK